MEVLGPWDRRQPHLELCLSFWVMSVTTEFVLYQCGFDGSYTACAVPVQLGVGHIELCSTSVFEMGYIELVLFQCSWDGLYRACAVPV